MKRGMIAFALAMGLFGFSAATYAVKFEKKGENYLIETDQYTITWRVRAPVAGYASGIVKGVDVPVFGKGLDQFGDRNLYHSANYAGWKDWGGTVDVKELEKANGKLVIQYTQDDGGSKKYVCKATYWDGAPYWKHEVTVEAKEAVVSFSDGHEPMMEVRNGGANEFGQWADPFPHGAVWNKGGYFAMFTEVGMVEMFGGWAPDGRFHLNHNALGKPIKKGEKSETLTYYMAMGKGDGKAAHDIAPSVVKEPKPLAVSPTRKLATTWGEIKTD